MRVAVLFHEGCAVRPRVVDAAVRWVTLQGATTLLCDTVSEPGRRAKQAAERFHVPVLLAHELSTSWSWWRRLLCWIYGEPPLNLQMLQESTAVLLFWDSSPAVKELLRRARQEDRKVLLIQVSGRDVIGRVLGGGVPLPLLPVPPRKK